MTFPGTVDPGATPALSGSTREYNAAHDLLERNLLAGRAGKLAYIDDRGACTYGELAEASGRCANALLELGMSMEQRLLLCLFDTIDFPVTFLGAIKAGIVPVVVNPGLAAADIEYMLADSRARAAVVSSSLLPAFIAMLGRLPHLKHLLVSGEHFGPYDCIADLLARATSSFTPAATNADDMCFWLYSSGSTGAPKGVVHVHSSMRQTAELYAQPIAGYEERDVVFSVSKLAFAYGLGSSLTFPLSVGATAVLMAERPTPAAILARLRKHRPSVFCTIPTVYAALLANPDLPGRGELNLRRCISAGEPLPDNIGRRWRETFGVDILDGIGSTEMLHIYLSNRPGEVEYGTTGRPVPGYELRIVGDNGDPVTPGESGELLVSGPTSALMYWNQRERTRRTFQGAWMRTSDMFAQRADGYYVYQGRVDDMFRVSGLYLSPSEVEAALVSHEAVLEAAVVAREGEDRLVKPMAFVVLKANYRASPQLAEELKQFIKARLAPYKYPRWIEFLGELPKAATGKIQRYRLRQMAVALPAPPA